MKSSRLESERLILRGYEESDIHAWQKWDTDPEIQKYLPGPQNEPVSYEQQLKYLNECLIEGNALYWSIVWKERNELVGTVSFTDIDPDEGIAELNIIVGEKKFWGKGIATEAIKMAIAIAKTDLGLKKIVAEVETANETIIKTLSNIGFIKESSSDSRTKYYLTL